MYKGKRVKKITHMSKRAALLVLSLVTILTVSVSGTLAYLIRSTNPAENTFIPGTIDTSTTEDFKDNTKTNVYVQNGKNEGTLPVYVRAKVVFVWTKTVDGKQVVLGDPVRDADIDIKRAENQTTKWREEADGFFYYSDILYPGESTDQLIESCKPVDSMGPEGAQLQVTILTQSIQAYKTKDAVKDAWGETVANSLPDAAETLARPAETPAQPAEPKN